MAFQASTLRTKVQALVATTFQSQGVLDQWTQTLGMGGSWARPPPPKPRHAAGPNSSKWTKIKSHQRYIVIYLKSLKIQKKPLNQPIIMKLQVAACINFRLIYAIFLNSLEITEVLWVGNGISMSRFTCRGKIDLPMPHESGIPPGEVAVVLEIREVAFIKPTSQATLVMVCLNYYLCKCLSSISPTFHRVFPLPPPPSQKKGKNPRK